MELLYRDKPLKRSRWRIAGHFGKALSRDFPAAAAWNASPSSRA
ncbi:hypothetical protein C4K22_2639 [Pseudomonas chlororaphis subsp. aurantiaca]|nr:hypothetical protein C4K22_2639 [Pseudomonas chlororaphis subsp. aurantiaca]